MSTAMPCSSMTVSLPPVSEERFGDAIRYKRCTACWLLALQRRTAGSAKVLVDPQGNEFCVLAKVVHGGPLAAICLDAADPGSRTVQGSSHGYGGVERSPARPT